MSHTTDVKEMTVTPAKAANYIKRHEAVLKADPTKHNRKLKKRAIERYADDMKEGRWLFNGETIKIGGDGRIVDGQHRLYACIKADTGFRTLVVEGVQDESFKTIDTGVPRTGGDLLGIEGHKNTRVLASALSNLWRWERGNDREFVDWSLSPSKSVLFEVLERHPDIEPFCGKAHVVAKLMSVGLAAACWYLFSKKDPVLADLFFSSLATGLSLNQDDPVYTLREKLIRDRGQLTHMLAAQQADFVIRAWKATRSGQKLTKLQAPRIDTANGSKSSKFKL